jgi:adenine-specific DNA-methyltransferase
MFAHLDRLAGDLLHAEGTFTDDDRRVAVAIGPQYGPVTAKSVEECLRLAYRYAYDVLVIAGFSFDAEADAVIQDDPNPRVRIHRVQVRPDVAPSMDGLLKNKPSDQLFTVSGLPRTRVEPTDAGEFVVHMEGVDIYNPLTGGVDSARADKVAAWFVDGDYDGGTFCISQAFFPDKTAWAKLSKALTNVVDEERFATFAGTVSLPFPAGAHRRVAVKVIDPRGNEVMRIHRLDEGGRYA